MKPSQLAGLMKKVVKAKHPLLVSSSPGVGKSAIATQVAADLKMNLIISHPVISDPTDFKGMPTVIDENGVKRAEWLPFGDLRALIEADAPTLWLIDDLGQAPLAVQAALMQLVHQDSRAINGQKISEHVSIVACTNERGDKAGVGGFIEPLKSRFVTHVRLEVDHKDWHAWALAHGINKMVCAFIKYKSELLNKPDANNDLRAWPCPRAWEHVSQLLAADVSPSGVLLEALIGAVGEAAAKDFSSFMKILDELPGIEEIVSSPKKTRLPTTANVCYAACGMLANESKKTNIREILQYVDRFNPEYGVYFGQMLRGFAPEVCETSAYTEWAVKNQENFK